MKTSIAVLLLSVVPAAMAQAPADAQARAKEEAAARAAWAGKVANFELCKSQDAVAEKYFADAKAAGKPTGEPVPTPECADPGPFTFLAPGEKPLEVSGAHSPAPTAATPPSTNEPAAQKQQPTSDTPAGPAGSTPNDESKPLEVSGAHSPAATATTPPSTNDPASEKQPPEQSGGTPEGAGSPGPAAPAAAQPAASSQAPAGEAAPQSPVEVPAPGGERVVPTPSSSGHTGNTPASPGTASTPSAQ